MIKNRKSYAYELAEAIQEAADKTIKNYNPDGGPGSHKTEDNITSGFIQAVTNIDYEERSIPDHFSIRPDTHQGYTEIKTGADLAIMYDVDIPEYTLQTAILVQAKRQGTRHYRKFRKAREQCGKMLSYTTDSFIFDYSKKEICAVPAVSVAGTDEHVFGKNTKYPKKYHKKGVGALFKELFMGYLGNEHTYNNIWSKRLKCSPPRRTDPIYPDGGNPNTINEDDGMYILTIRVTSEEIEG